MALEHAAVFSVPAVSCLPYVGVLFGISQRQLTSEIKVKSRHEPSEHSEYRAISIGDDCFRQHDEASLNISQLRRRFPSNCP